MSKHMRIRKILNIITTPVLLIPDIIIIFGGIFYLFISLFPLEAVKIFTTGSVILWGVAGVSSLFLGRAYCSHICPITGVFNLVSWITKDRDILSTEYPAILGVIFTAIWGTAPSYLCIRILLDRLGYLSAGPVFYEPSVILLAILFLGSIILSRTSGKSDVPHYICPFSPYSKTGMKISAFLKLPSLKLRANKENCVNCKSCISQKHCLMNMNIGKKLREDEMDFTECLNCGACSEVCKFKTVEYYL